MFCYQCEQTDRTDSARPPQPAELRLLGDQGQLRQGRHDRGTAGRAGRRQPRHRPVRAEARELGAPDPQFAAHASFDLFTTLTNVNFNATRFMALIAEAVAMREQAKRPTRPPPAPPASSPKP